MIPTKVLCFELFGDYAQYKKYFTNMSPLSFSIPPRTVLAGIIGAILGIDKAENPGKYTLENSFFALSLINPVKKTKISHNYLKTKSLTNVSRFEEHKPTNIEFLTNVRYRLYFSCEDSVIYDKLKVLLEGHSSVYTVCLGISGCLANFDYLGEFQLTSVAANQKLTINTIIPTSSVSELVIDTPLKFQKVVLPATMNNNRVVTKYDEVLFEMEGNPISIIARDNCYQVNGLSDIIHGF